MLGGGHSGMQLEREEAWEGVYRIMERERFLEQNDTHCANGVRVSPLGGWFG